jgi:anti-sigma regulatory factor (Ser/Thr protein kinase)
MQIRGNEASLCASASQRDKNSLATLTEELYANAIAAALKSSPHTIARIRTALENLPGVP